MRDGIKERIHDVRKEDSLDTRRLFPNRDFITTGQSSLMTCSGGES